jgi:hypothetical protein
MKRWRLMMLGVAALPAAAMAQMNPGLWSLVLTVDSNGTREAMPAVSECISQKDIDDGTRALPRPDGACKLTNVARGAERTTYDLACMNGTLLSQGRAEIRFAGDSYTGAVEMTVYDRGGIAQPMALQINAKRVGDCSK